MKEIITYIAYDDMEFSQKEDCIAYEQEAMKMIDEAEKVYSFFDKDMNIFLAPLDCTIEEYLNWFEETIDKCEYIHIYQEPSTALCEFLNYNIGYTLPINGTGFFRYDWQYSEWRPMEKGD